MDNENNDNNIFDPQGYRYNVGIIVLNSEGKAFWGKRRGQDAWQFPQGGVNAGETCEAAMLRELHEETGLLPHQISILAVTKSWLRYRLPPRYRRNKRPGIVQCVGQKQKWFLLRLTDSDAVFDFNATGSPEFDDWCWIDYWKPADSVVQFKRDVYWKALQELAENVPEVPLLKKPPRKKYYHGRQRLKKAPPSETQSKA